jgi:hypothetical protein
MLLVRRSSFVEHQSTGILADQAAQMLPGYPLRL